MSERAIDGTHAIIRFKAYGSDLEEVKANAAAEARRVLGDALLDYRMSVDMEPCFTDWAHKTSLYEADITVEPIPRRAPPIPNTQKA